MLSEDEIVSEFLETMLYTSDQPAEKPLDWLGICHEYIEWRKQKAYGTYGMETFRLRVSLINAYGPPDWSTLRVKSNSA
jgi:hypothetical protein